MWKKGEIVWVSLNNSDTWIPGQILDPSESFGVLVSFFGLMEPRYVPKPFLRSFDRDFGALISDSWRYPRFVNRALRAQFWNISSGLWCSCQPPIDSPYFDREISFPRSPLDSDWDSALGFVRDTAISLRVPLRRLAETNNSTAQILSFRRYTVDVKRSESVYEEIRESANLMDRLEESNWYLDLDPSNDMDCVDLVSMLPERGERDIGISRDQLPKDIHCCSSVSLEQPLDKAVRIFSWNTKKPLTKSGSSFLKACGTVARSADHKNDDGHLSRRKERCQVEQSICLLNSEPHVEDIIEGAPPDVMIETLDDIIGSDGRTVASAKQLSSLVDASNDKVFLAKPVSFVVPEACETLASSVKETYAKPRNKLDCSLISAKTSGEESSGNGTRANSSNNALEESDNVEIGQVSLHTTGSSNKECSTAEKLRSLEAATTVENQTGAVGVKRKASRDKASAANSKRKKKAGQQSTSTEKPVNLHLMKDMRLADPKCLRMKFSSRHENLPSKPELLKKFSVFGKVDASRTDINQEESSAKVVFVQSIDAVTAYQFARSKKFTLGRSKVKVMYRLDPFEEDNELNKTPVSQTPQKCVLSPRSCLKKHGSVDKEEGRRNRKVKFEMETN